MHEDRHQPAPGAEDRSLEMAWRILCDHVGLPPIGKHRLRGGFPREQDCSRARAQRAIFYVQRESIAVRRRAGSTSWSVTGP